MFACVAHGDANHPCFSAERHGLEKSTCGNHDQTHLWLAELFQVRGNRLRTWSTSNNEHLLARNLWTGCRNDWRGNLDILSDASFTVVLHEGRGRVVRSWPPSTWCTGELAARFAFVERAVMGPAARWSQQTSALIDSNRRTSESEHPVACHCFVALAIGIRELKQGWIAKGSRRSERIIAQLCVNGVCGQFKYRMYCATH